MKQMVYNHNKAAGMEILQCWRAGPILGPLPIVHGRWVLLYVLIELILCE
jgi:hypothetical protein